MREILLGSSKKVRTFRPDLRRKRRAGSPLVVGRTEYGEATGKKDEMLSAIRVDDENDGYE